LVLGLSLAGSILLVMIEVPALRRQSVDAPSPIIAKAAPLEDAGVSPLPPVEVPLETADPDEVSDAAANPLVQTEPARTAETPVAGLDGASAPKPSPSPSPVPTAAPSRRFGYDLEHGTPMPPDAREPKPVY
jgi:hypothetical protein